MSAELAPRVVQEALAVCGELLNSLEYSDTTLALFDRIQAQVTREPGDFIAAGLTIGAPPTAEALAVHLLSVIRYWFEGASRALDSLSLTIVLLDFDQARYADRLVSGIVMGLSHLALLHEEAATDALAGHEAVADAFGALARYLAEAGHPTLAFRCANVSCNLLSSTDLPVFLAASEQALGLSLALGDDTFIGVSLARVAVATARAVDRGERTELEAFDAIERALRNLPSDPGHRGMALRLCWALVQTPPYTALQLPALLNLPSEQRPVLPPEIGDITLILNQVADGDPGSWLQAVQYFSQIAIELENSRLQLQPRPSDELTVSDWATWSFQHKSYRRAIPDGSSLLRERDLPELLLVMQHELTHILSMYSHIGAAIIALRIASFDRELSLWSIGRDQGAFDLATLIRSGVAPLDGVSLLGLPQAEQSLEISRKSQIVRECWEPWFEGVAIFAELAGDPTQDPEHYSPMTEILSQMIDVFPRDFAAMDAEQRGAWVRGHMASFEQRYAEAIAALAPARLRAYLDVYHQHYLAGYLAVRAVVASWRRTLARPLSGAQAIRILLHATRFGTSATFPNLGMPLKAFSVEVQRRMVAWVADLAHAPRESLETVLDGYSPTSGSPILMRWRGGRIETRKADDTAVYEDAVASISSMVDQAIASLSGSNADLDRVPGSDAVVRELLAAVAESLSKVGAHSTLVEELVALYLRPQGVMPIGQIEAPFWLHRGARLIFCLIRTTEVDRDTNKPGYNGLIFGLDPDPFAALEAEVQAHRQPRMTIARIADLAQADGGGSGRGYGRNYYVLRYGTWLHVQPRGLWLGSEDKLPPSLVLAVRARANDNPWLALDAEMLANGIAGAMRTRDWIEQVEQWEAGGQAFPIEPWADYVAGLADEVIDRRRRPERDMVERRLLALVCGEATAEVLSHNGLRGLVAGDRSIIQPLIGFLDTSARLPSSDPPPLLVPELFVETPYGWDVAAIQTE